MVKLSKTLHLISTGFILPAALLYLILHRQFLLYQDVMLLGTYLMTPFWLVYFIGMGTYYFPLKTGEALKNSILLLIQFFIFSYCSNANWLFASYSFFYTSFVGFAFFILIYMGWGFFTPPKSSIKLSLLYLLILFFVSLYIYGLSGPFLDELVLMKERFPIWIVLLIALAQIGNAGWGHFQTMRHKNEEKMERDQEWQRWTNATAGTLILSLCATLFLLIFLSPENQAFLGSYLGN